MSRSRAKISRTKIRHRRQLMEQRQRELHREEKRYNPQEFSLTVFLLQHKIELVLGILMTAAITGIVFLAPDRKALQDAMHSVSSVIEEKSWGWEEDYPYGYKVLALTQNDIIPTSYDTLPKGLKIDWKKISIARIQMKESGSLEEKITIEIPDITYAAAGVSGLTVKAAFIRAIGATTILAEWGQFKFVAKIVEDTSDQVFCLFGLQER